MRYERQHLSVGTGRVYFERSYNGATSGELYLGDAVGFHIDRKVTFVDRKKSYNGVVFIGSKDLIEEEASFSFSVNNSNIEAIGLWTLGADRTVESRPAVRNIESITVRLGRAYRLGRSGTDFGDQYITNVIVKRGATVIAAETNYEVNEAAGMIYFGQNPAVIIDGETLSIQYDIRTAQSSTVEASPLKIEGALRFVGKNISGYSCEVYAPRVSLTPDTSFNIADDSNWHTLSFSAEALRKSLLVPLYRIRQFTYVGDANWVPAITVEVAELVYEGAADMVLSATSLDFGSVDIGETESRYLTIYNVGGEPLTITGITATGNYTLTLPSSLTIASGGSAAVAIAFAPLVLGSNEGSLTITTAAGSETVALVGVGTGTSASNITLSPSSVAFGSTAVGESSQIIVTVTNSSSSDITIEEIVTTGTDFTATMV